MSLPGTVAGWTAELTNAAPVPRMLRLRDATRLVHSCIEGVLPVLEPGLTRARYTHVIEAFHGFYAPLEAPLARAAAAEGTALRLEQRAKLPLLASDLRALGRTPVEIAALPRCLDLPAVPGPSHALGVLYVIEGSTLGGQVIRKHLRDVLGIDESTGAAYFTGYGAGTGAMWTAFADHVNRSATIEIEVAIDAAVETFQTLTRWLESQLGAS